MIKLAFLCGGALLLAGCATSRPVADEKVLFKNPVVVGQGPSKLDASLNAMAAIPATYETDKGNSPVLSCAKEDEKPFWSTQSQEYVCRSGYKSSVAVLPKDSILRAEVIAYMESLKSPVKSAAKLPAELEKKAAIVDPPAETPAARIQ